jgi:hypothetical protein
MKHFILIALFYPILSFSQVLKSPAVYLKDPKLSKEAKSFYKKLPLFKKNPDLYYNDIKTNNEVVSILDSMTAKNETVRPFYIYLVNRNLGLLDGELYSVALTRTYDLIDRQPSIFFQYMLDNPAEKKMYWDKWVNLISMYSQAGFCAQYQREGGDSCLKFLRKKVITNLKSKPAADLTRQFFSAMNVRDEPAAALILHKEDAGKTYHVTTDKIIKITLRECRGCASVWEIAEPDKNKVSHFSEEFSNPSCYNCTGGMQDHTLIFSLDKPGKTSLTFTYFEEKLTINFIVH